MTRRLLTSEERNLWERITDSVNRMPGVTTPGRDRQGLPLVASKKAATPQLAAGRGRQRVEAGPHGGAAPTPALNAGDPRLVRHISRGRRDIEATLDLHGMTQDQAYASLSRFVSFARARKYRVILIITGKGSPQHQNPVRGILRRRFLEWVDGPLREHIVSIAQAHQRHGGSGAFYLILKKSEH